MNRTVWLRDDVVAYLQTLRATVELARIIAILCALRDGDEPDDEDDEDQRKFKPPAILLPDEIKRVSLAPSKPRSSLLLRFLYATAARVKEAISLRLADLNRHNGHLFIRGGKGEIDRYILCDPATVEAIHEWQQGSPPETRPFDFTFPTSVYPVLERAATQVGVWQKYEALGLRLSPHCLRHAFATHLYERGMPLWTIKALLGHSILRMTEIYTHGHLDVWRQSYNGTRSGSGDERGNYEGKEPKRDEVVRFLLDSLKADATLDEVIDALCEYRLSILGPVPREYVDELGPEIALDEQFRGDRLPLIVSREEIALLIQEELLFHVLYATGMRLEEALALTRADLDPQAQTLRLIGPAHYGPFPAPTGRRALADPATFTRLLALEGDRLFPLDAPAVEALLRRRAAETGLLDRYRAMDRELTTRVFRHAFGSHRYEDGMDTFTLKALMGHEFLATTTVYSFTAAERHRADYQRCHPLACGEVMF